MTFENIIVESHPGAVVIRLNRPGAMNAFNNALMDDLTAALDAAEADPQVRAIVITGSDKAFAAGADIKEMADKTYAHALAEDFITRNWERAARCRKPLIAAVAGFALGGGCELAMMCDIVIAADNARFGQPEITIGVVPGAGGSQRLTRAVGKAKAMDMVLTGRMIDAAEAERCGLVSRIVPLASLMDEALAVAAKLAALPPLALLTAKALVQAAFETPLSQGMKQERLAFQSMFGLHDQREGMAAFLEKRKPVFRGE